MTSRRETEGTGGSRDDASRRGAGAAPLELAGGGSPPTATAGPSSPVGEASAGWWPLHAGASWPLVSHAVSVLDVRGWSQHAGCSLCCTFITTLGFSLFSS